MNTIQVPLEKLGNIKLMVGTPMYGSRCHGSYLESILSLIKLCNALGIQIGVSSICSESLLQRSRNYVVDEFLRSGFTHLMLVDTDVQFKPEYVISFLMIDKDVIGAQYPEKKMIQWGTIIHAIKEWNVKEDKLQELAGDLVYNHIVPTDPIEVDVLKMGFVMIKRRVFDKLQVAYPEHFYKPDHIGITNFDGIRRIQMFFSVEIDPETRKLVPEYEFFCKMWRKIGGKIYMCPWVVLSHVGLYWF